MMEECSDVEDAVTTDRAHFPFPTPSGPPPPYTEQHLAVDSPYLSFADNVFNKYRNYYQAQTKGDIL